MLHIAIVGAGLFGRLLALRLTQLDYQVSLYEKDDLDATQSAGYVAAAMLAPFAEASKADELVVKLGVESLDLWPSLLKDLPEEVFFQRNGSLVVAHTQDQGDYLSFINKVQHQLEGMDIQDGFERCNKQQLQSYEPELADHFQQGVFIKEEGQLDNRALYRATKTALETSQVECLINSKVDELGESIDPLGKSFVVSNHGEREYDWVIDCRGLGAKKDVQGLRGVRGEVIRMHAPDVNLTRPVRLMHPRYPLYIVPKPGQEYVIGATEIESDDDSNISVRSTLELLTAVYSLHSGFAEARILETLVGCRPALPDNEPRVRVGRRHIQVNGLYRHGYLITPAILNEVVELIATDSIEERRANSSFSELYQTLDKRTNPGHVNQQDTSPAMFN